MVHQCSIFYQLVIVHHNLWIFMAMVLVEAPWLFFKAVSDARIYNWYPVTLSSYQNLVCHLSSLAWHHHINWAHLRVCTMRNYDQRTINSLPNSSVDPNRIKSHQHYLLLKRIWFTASVCSLRVRMGRLHA